MSQRIFVGNLPFSATDSQLNELFGKHGEVVSAEVVKDRFSDRSRGFGFVEMASAEAATAAISALNGHQMDGRALTVNEARARSEGGPRGGGGGNRGGSRGPRRDFGDANRW
ncbi:RNA-binding protein [candidate division WOR-3 bacterium]|nr:RNA-binding protein [candidate division WOR-3 bacterium]